MESRALNAEAQGGQRRGFISNEAVLLPRKTVLCYWPDRTTVAIDLVLSGRKAQLERVAGGAKSASGSGSGFVGPAEDGVFRGSHDLVKLSPKRKKDGFGTSRAQIKRTGCP